MHGIWHDSIFGLFGLNYKIQFHENIVNESQGVGLKIKLYCVFSPSQVFKVSFNIHK